MKFSRLLIIGLSLLGLGALFSVPSSSRASDFVKVGSPVAVETQFYGMASVYDRNPKQYEAWAVGATVGTSNGVLIYYNGNFWTKIAIPDNLPPLRAVSAFRYLSGTTWRTAAWAVGDNGTILRKDPNSNTAWVQEKKYITNIIRCGSPSGAACAGTAVVGDVCGQDVNGANITCINVNGLACTDADVSDAARCSNWTTNNLKTVAVGSASYAITGGERAGSNPKNLIQHTDISMAGVSTSNWSDISTSAITNNDDILGSTFIDLEHAWLVGHDKSTNQGRLWQYTNRNGWAAISTASWLAAEKTNMRFTSVAPMLRKAATVADTPLSSVVWIGAEDMTNATTSAGTGRIVRYDESTGARTVTTTTKPVRSMALSQRASGTGVELLTNGTFSADRQDNSATNSRRFADGWKGQGYYTDGRDRSVSGTGLLPGDSGRSVAIEPWQSRPTRSRVVAQVQSASQSWPFGGASYPVIGGFDNGKAFNTTLQETDITKKLIENTGDIWSGITDPDVIGIETPGFIRIPKIASGTPIRFRIEHPNGRITFYMENDTNNRACERADGSLTGVMCPSGTGCGAGETCVDHTSFASNVFAPTLSNALSPTWRVGTCSNKHPAVVSAVSCFDNLECQLGSCTDDPSIKCRLDEGGFNQCHGTPCVPWASVPNACVGASDIPLESNYTVTFSANAGIQAHSCVGGSDDGKSCIDSTQCSGGTCKIANGSENRVCYGGAGANHGQACSGTCDGTDTCQSNAGSGWVPFFLRYYQLNTAHCSSPPAGQRVPCVTNGDCTELSAGSCVTGKWCVAGTKRGQSCTAHADCGAGANCQDQLTTHTCAAEPTRQCISNSDCANGDTCTIGSNPTSTLKLYWDVDPVTGSPTGSPTFPVPDDHLAVSTQNQNRQSVVQEVPFSTVPGQTYRVTGRYKAEFTGAYANFSSAADPRIPLNGSRVGVRTKCKSATIASADTCGYDFTVFTTNQATGVTNGTCNVNPIACKTNADCVTAGAGTTCTAGWTDFSATLTKQNRDNLSNAPSPDDPGQGLEVECFAESGARVWCDSISVTPITDSALPANDIVDVWAVGDNGLVARNTLDTVASLPTENWQVQLQPVTSNIRAITSADIYHLWATGDHDSLENATLFRLSPGNVAGWAWIGTASSVSGIDPVGWVDFNCGNSGSCLTQPSAFGVNVDIAPVSAANPVTGEFSGSAWLGSTDPNETADFGTCQNKPTGYCVSNSSISCQDDATCAGTPGAGPTCVFNTVCTGTTCSGSAGRTCINSTQCFGTCSKNQGFRCTKDSDCQVKCSTNPSACHVTGWMSFDKNLVGTPPSAPYNSGAQSYTARFDVANDAVSGWARLQFGRCVNATTPSASTNRSCFSNSQCGTETCDWSAAPSGLSSTQAGWVKLRSTDNTTAIAPMQCSDCSAGGTPTSGSCKICAANLATPIPAPVACNSCGSCTLKRCTASSPPWQACTLDADCGPTGGECKSFGICNDGSTDVCFSDSDCGSGTCTFGAQCTSCSSCQTYGVSIDYGVTKNFVGYGYSPDLGWIDFSRVSLGGQLFLQTQFGDIYAGGNIGGPTTGIPPGFPGGSTRCNATYRIVSSGTITNFCSAGQPSPPGTTLIDPTTSPFIAPNSEKILIPSEENRYTTSIGTIDREGLVTVVNPSAAVKRNKYGDEVVEYTGDTNISTIFSCSGTGTCTPRLGGKVYHIIGVDATNPGDLSIDRDITFQPGTATISGAGTFVVDGKLKVNSNLQYFQTGTSSISERRGLPSVGFFVKDEVAIGQGVSVMVGAYYSEDTIRVDIGDNPLTVSGLMIAQNFDFRRRYRGIGSGSQEASELVIYDGRLQANTPPGLSAISASFPNVQELVP